MTKQLVLEIFNVRKKTFVTLFAIVLVNCGLYFFANAYQQPRIERLQNQWMEKRKLQTGGQVDVSTVYRQGTADLESFRSRIPYKREFARLVGEIFETAANNGLKVGGVTYKPEVVKGENLLLYGVGLNVSGKYAGIKSFISDLQRSRNMISVDSISLNSGSPTEEVVGLRLQLSTYLRTEEK